MIDVRRDEHQLHFAGAQGQRRSAGGDRTLCSSRGMLLFSLTMPATSPAGAGLIEEELRRRASTCCMPIIENDDVTISESQIP